MFHNTTELKQLSPPPYIVLFRHIFAYRNVMVLREYSPLSHMEIFRLFVLSPSKPTKAADLTPTRGSFI